MGWELPEIVEKIAGPQQISIYISRNSDIYQLGMALWALTMGENEPERREASLSVEAFLEEVPEWY